MTDLTKPEAVLTNPIEKYGVQIFCYNDPENFGQLHIQSCKTYEK